MLALRGVELEQVGEHLLGSAESVVAVVPPLPLQLQLVVWAAELAVIQGQVAREEVLFGVLGFEAAAQRLSVLIGQTLA